MRLFLFNAMQEEIWKDIPDYEGCYQVSNLGRARSLERTVLTTNGKKISVKSRVLSAKARANEYPRLNLSKQGRIVTYKIHTLVAIAFLGHKPRGFKIVVDHINNDKSDNRLENLQLTTNRQNSSKDRKNKTSRYTGVSWVKKSKKWQSLIQIRGKEKCLGHFISEEHAHLAYQKALKSLNEQQDDKI